MKEKAKDVPSYIKTFSKEVQDRLNLVRDTIMKTAPNCEESIRYNMPAYKIGKDHIYFSGYKKHIGMYPMYGMPDLEEELKPFRGKDTKDSIHFLHEDQLPVKLIARIVKEKMKQGRLKE